MMKFPVVQGEAFTQVSTYADLEQVLSVDGWTKETLGPSSDLDANVYGFSYGDPSKPVIHIEAQIHGQHEWGTSHWMAQFMQLIHDPPTSVAPMVRYLLTRASFYAIPCVNPYGYIHGTYGNANFGDGNEYSVNLNRNFPTYWNDISFSDTAQGNKGSAPFSEPETQYIRDKVQALKPILFVDAHTYGGSDDDLNIGSGSPDKRIHDALVRDCMASLACSLNYRPHFLPVSSGRPTARSWGAEQTSVMGGTPVSILLEPGSEADTQRQATVALNMLMQLCVSTVINREQHVINIEERFLST